MPPTSHELNALITAFRESYSSVNMSRESKRLKKSRSDWLNSGNALIQQHFSEKMRFSCFPVLPGSKRYGDGAGNTAEENSSVFSLIHRVTVT